MTRLNRMTTLGKMFTDEAALAYGAIMLIGTVALVVALLVRAQRRKC